MGTIHNYECQCGREYTYKYKRTKSPYRCKNPDCQKIRLVTGKLIGYELQYIPKKGGVVAEPEKSEEYKHGYDAANNGGNSVNSHFSIFTSPEKTAEWQQGHDDAVAEKAKK